MLLLYGDKARCYGAPLSDDDTMKLVKDELHRVCTVCRAELAEEARLARIGQRNARVIALRQRLHSG